MNILISITLLLTISCCEGRNYPHGNILSRSYTSVLTVPNGGPWGVWGQTEFCKTGHARGFSIKVSPEQEGDNTGLDGIVLYCNDRSVLHSIRAPWGDWEDAQYCPAGSLLKSFSLKVKPYQGRDDDLAATNIQFRCTDGTLLMGDGLIWGRWGPWAYCPEGNFICGMQTKVEDYQWGGDDTSLNDVKFYCCKV